MTPTIISNKRKVQLIWVMTAFLITFFTINSLGTCIIAVLMGKQWNTLNGTEKFMTIIVVLVNWSTMMMAFLNRSMNYLLGEMAFPIVANNNPPSPNV